MYEFFKGLPRAATQRGASFSSVPIFGVFWFNEQSRFSALWRQGNGAWSHQKSPFRFRALFYSEWWRGPAGAVAGRWQWRWEWRGAGSFTRHGQGSKGNHSGRQQGQGTGQGGRGKRRTKGFPSYQEWLWRGRKNRILCHWSQLRNQCIRVLSWLS